MREFDTFTHKGKYFLNTWMVLWKHFINVFIGVYIPKDGNQFSAWWSLTVEQNRRPQKLKCLGFNFHPLKKQQLGKRIYLAKHLFCCLNKCLLTYQDNKRLESIIMVTLLISPWSCLWYCTICWGTMKSLEKRWWKKTWRAGLQSTLTTYLRRVSIVRNRFCYPFFHV